MSTTKFNVALNGFVDEDGLPISVTILVDRENVQEFTNFLKEEEGNVFVHAEGNGVTY